ncbi:hypothetical protein AGLY_002059 [Aphis glycines]|uniref:Endonuclease/exonuclease/phosphatase domain-containing protein n=1 Tax=Aphis glycines TaxID=307491 RepID=A0A6G0U3Z7_APHGL|nr:hypothetical protein AGLY_002059 [Aphis glycines]
MAFQEIFEMINFLQVNLNGNRGAQQLLDQTVTQKDTDIVILSEPYVRTDGGDRLLFSLESKLRLEPQLGRGNIHHRRPFARRAEITDWEVLDDIYLSDHAYITFRIDLQRQAPQHGWPQAASRGTIHPGWALKQINLEAFNGHVNSTPLPVPRGFRSADAALRAAEALDGYIVDACNASMPLRTSGPAGRKLVYWWSDHIVDLRSTAFRLRRAYQAIDLIAAERGKVKARMELPPIPGERPLTKSSIKRNERKATIAKWHSLWLHSRKALWPHRLIPDLARWINRSVPKVAWSYHMTQALTGHGCFQHYLHRMDRAASPRCMHCECWSDTAEHTLFRCPNWDSLREGLRDRLGHPPAVEDVPDMLCGPVFEDLPVDHQERYLALSEAEETFRIFYKMVIEILTLKEQEERVR